MRRGRSSQGCEVDRGVNLSSQGCEVHRGVKFVIEHLEPALSKWLLYEYENAAKVLGKSLIFTNIKRPPRILTKLSTVERRSALRLFPHEALVILDPCAKKTLTPQDMKGCVAVIGGILGGHPPRGRTKTLLTLKAPKAKVRNLGSDQFTIDGAAYIAKLIAGGKKLQSVPIKRGLILKTKLKPSGVYEVQLPYAYPIVAGKPLISRKLLKYLIGTTAPEIRQSRVLTGYRFPL